MTTKGFGNFLSLNNLFKKLLKIWEKSRKFGNCKIYKKNTLVPVPE
jgi:hypothetical protein